LLVIHGRVLTLKAKSPDIRSKIVSTIVDASAVVLRRITKGSIARELGCPAQLIFAIFAIVAYSTQRIDPGPFDTARAAQFANACQMLSLAVFPTARGTIDRPHCVLGTRIPTVIAVSPSAAADFLRNTLRFFTSDGTC